MILGLAGTLGGMREAWSRATGTRLHPASEASRRDSTDPSVLPRSHGVARADFYGSCLWQSQSSSHFDQLEEPYGYWATDVGAVPGAGLPYRAFELIYEKLLERVDFVQLFRDLLVVGAVALDVQSYMGRILAVSRGACCKATDAAPDDC